MMRNLVACVAAVAVCCALGVAANDPAPGWLAYLTTSLEDVCGADSRLTHMEAKWVVPPSPQPSGSFYSPWFGADTTDNMCLIQPVNPWFGSSWAAYTEYFQWSDMYNQNSNQINVNSGDVMHGQLTFLGTTKQSYRLQQTDMTTGQTSSMTIPVQQHQDGSYKKYTVLYFVFEKVANRCVDYPPSNKVTFYDIKVFCNGRQVNKQLKWTAGVVDEVCDFQAHYVNSTTVTITWNANSQQRITPEMLARNNATKHQFVPRRR